MKQLLKTVSLVFFISVMSTGLKAQNISADSTGLPGDNFDLQGALQMFQKASSPEDFEKLLNSQDNNVNNLDLNNDGEIDYVKVIDKMDKADHAFILQVAVSETENQDIAVIELEKTGDASAIVQIIGDEDMYGEQTIVEPDGGEENAFLFRNNNSASSGPNVNYNGDYDKIIVNVWFWPSVRFVYAPVYRPWVSPWRWRHYPAWWSPWRPYAWHVWHPRRVVYHRNFVVVPTHRVMRAHKIYAPYRTTSVSVRTRNATAVNNYRVTRTRTTVTGPAGRSATKKTTTVRGKDGKVKAKKTRTRRH